MKDTSLYLRVDSAKKVKAQEILAANGYTMSNALDICLQKISSGDLSILKPAEEDMISEYPDGFFTLFGSDKDGSKDIVSDIPAGDDMEQV